MTPDHAEAKSTVARFVRDLNEAWLAGRIEDLYPFFHERVIVVPPGSAEGLVGRNAMVASYRQFAEQATIRRFEELGLGVDVFDKTAIATVRFAIVYELGGQVFDEFGTDLLVMVHGDQGWQIVWRTQLNVTDSEGD